MGAVAYAPKVVTIWEGFKQWFHEHDLAFDFVLYSNYEKQVEDQFNGTLDVAWNSPLAWVRAERIARARGVQVSAVAMRDTDVDQTCFFTTGNHLDRETQRSFGLRKELRCVLGNPQRVGRHRADLIRRKSAQSLVEARQRLDRPQLRRTIQQLALPQAGSETDGFLQSVKGVYLVIDDARHLQPETVGAEVDCGEKFISHASMRGNS